ncbi:MAG: GMC family oxidoreductase [Rhodococcus sp.]|nr:GMC family oxidoreductase [Rhodococcus sp. (in: high G+C Gram-positive bacteria)]
MRTTSRRAVLLAAAGMGAAALSVRRPPEAHAHTQAGVVIIGSGYAGAVTALRLAQQGIASTIVERGRWWPVTDRGDTFATPTRPDGRATWIPGVATGVLEVAPGTGVNCLAGAGVGGGSLVNYAVMMTPSEELFRQSFGDSLDYGEMAERWYPRARTLLGCTPIPDDVLASPAYAGAREFSTASSQAGLDTIRPDLAIDWNIVRREIAGHLRPSATAGECMWGMNSGAKLSVDRTVLAAALATGLVTVRELHHVTAIRQVAGGGESGAGAAAEGATNGQGAQPRYTVSCAVLDHSGKTRSTTELQTSTLVLAAGSLGTTQLLVRAREQGDIATLGASIGTGWGTGGDHVTIRLGIRDSRSQGGPAPVVATDWRSNTPLSLLNFPLGIGPLDGVTQNALAVGIVPPIGTFTYNRLRDRVDLHWPEHDRAVRASSRGVDAMLGRIGEQLPRTAPALSLPLVTAHPLGGAVLGAAADSYGRVHGHPGLHVVDSALIPGSTGAVPPALTVTAIADRCASALAADLIRETS